MLFIPPAVVHMDAATPCVAEVQKVTPPSREIPVWRDALELAQLDNLPSNANQNSAAPGATIGGTPGINAPATPTPVGAAPAIPSANNPNGNNPNGNTYGTQQEPTGTTGATAPVTPGVPGPGAGTGGGSGMSAPEMATPPAGNMDSGSSYKNLSSPYNSTGGGAGLTGTGMGTTATPPTGVTTPAPGSTSVTPTTPAPTTSGASGTR